MMLASKEVIVPLLLPLKGPTHRLTLSKDSTITLVSHVVSSGVDAVFTLANTTEFQYVTLDEKIANVRWVSNTAESINPGDDLYPGCRVIVGITADTEAETRQTILAMNKLIEAGHRIDSYVWTKGYEIKESVPSHVRSLTELTDRPFLLYSNPAIAHPSFEDPTISIDEAAQLAHHPQVIGLKDSTTDFKTHKQYLHLRSPNFQVYQGHETLALESLRMGSDGFVPSMGNLFPVLCLRIAQNYGNRSGKVAQDELDYRGKVLHGTRKTGIAKLKEGARQLELISTNYSYVQTPPMKGINGPIRDLLRFI